MSMTVTRTNAIRAALLDTVHQEPAARRARVRRRFATWGAVGIAATAVLGTAGTMVMQAAPVTEASLVHCFQSSDRGPDGRFPEKSAAYTPGEPDQPSALELCTAMWAHGAFDPSFTPANDADASAPVPARLTVCVMEDGSAAVVPGESLVCQKMGLSPLKS